MAKKARKAAAAKAGRAKTSARRKPAAAKGRRTAAAVKKTKPPAKRKTAAKPRVKPAESLAHKIEGAFKAVLETLTDAEQLHHRLDPEPTRDLDPE